MKLLSRIWFPIAVTAVAAAQFTMSEPRTVFNEEMVGLKIETVSERPDTVIYPANGYKLNWTEEDFELENVVVVDTMSFITDSLSAGEDSLALVDTLPKLTARDTIFPPDSLKDTDPFRYKYYVALLDSATHVFVRDSLKAAGDSLDWPRLDSLYIADSIALEQLKFDQWFNSLSKQEKKNYYLEKKAEQKIAAIKEAQALKEEKKAIKDSILADTPRILETFALPDSLQYQRIVHWNVEQEFHKINITPADTGFNYRFNDLPFLRNDVNATWLGVAGSPVQYYNWFNRRSKDKVSFYEAHESWSFTPETAPMYNTKTPYTELAYFGTLLFSGTEKESDDLHLLTTQNLTPEFNFTLDYDRYGGGGILTNENTINKNTYVTANYLGKKYMAHAGYLYNGVSRGENGGVMNLGSIRDTTIDAREIDVFMNSAKSKIKKNVLFLDQQYRIPFTFLDKLKEKGNDTAPEDTLEGGVDRDITTAFIGHSTEYSSYRRWYNDDMTKDKNASEYYGDRHYINPNLSSDSLRVARLDNKFFIRLQPWSDDAIISKLNVGIGDRLLTYYTFDPTFTQKKHNTRWNSTYLYAGAEGSLKNYIHWDAKGEYVFLGDEINDMNLDANLGFNIYPFRKARTSPLTVDLHFDTSLDEPEYYNQHMYTNHFKWDNEFSKISTTRIQGRVSIPRWNIEASAGYALLANNIYYDTLGFIRQNTTPMSILSADLHKEFVMGVLHLDNRVLFQMSSNQEVVPLPTLALNLKYFVQFDIEHGTLLMQIGANGFYNTEWYAPGWNPALGVFHNQNENKYTNGPFVDAFINMQWKRATIYVKFQNANQGWPMKKYDYFSADRYITTQRMLKIGIYWPFYMQPNKHEHAENER